ncbi:MAG: His/Gly/Thr/Pro-type tRNA ligase C-terminal domain-containing protein, partial [Anaerolineae bacterium]
LQVKEHLGIGPSLGLAARRGIPLAVIVGLRERTEGTAVLRDMEERTQRTVPLWDLGQAVLAAWEERRERR